MTATEPNPTILIVEDNVAVSLALNMFFEDCGYVVLTADSIPAFEKAISTKPPILACITDMELGSNSKGGLKVLARMQEAYPDVPVYENSGSYKPAPDDGFTRHFGKKTRASQMEEIVRAAIGVKLADRPRYVQETAALLEPAA